MQAFPRRNAARVVVVAMAAVSLAVSLPNIVPNIVPMYGNFGYFLDEDNRVVAVVGARALHVGVKVGDRVDQRALPADSRYYGSLARLPRIGMVTAIPFIRDGVARRVTLRADYYARFWQHDGVVAAVNVLQLYGNAPKHQRLSATSCNILQPSNARACWKSPISCGY